MDYHSEENIPEPNIRTKEPPKNNESNKVLIKAAIIACLIFVMLIPSSLISNLVKERATRQQQVMKEVSSKWAEPQTVTGPILMLPYLQTQKDVYGKIAVYKKKAYFLPDQLNINGTLQPETRKRNIYAITLYKTDLNLSGSFNKINLEALNIAPESVQWQEAQLLVGLDDTRGLEDEVKLQWNGSQSVIESALEEKEALQNGLMTKVTCNATDAFSFNIHLKFKGSENLFFTPTGKNTTVTIRSSWKNPSFDGRFLPNNDPQPNKDGFIAQWKIPHTARLLKQSWTNSKQEVQAYAFGVRLIQPTDSYSKTDRTVKYALLFIGLCFTVFFFIEILQKQQIHPLQYLLVSIALTVFYTLLLSLSEYLGFNMAYAIAVIATVSLIGLYVWNIFKAGKIALGFTLALAALYGYIFFLIQLQDYALVVGSIGLFIVVALAMYSSRKINWYQIGKKELHLASD